jgi:Na+-driven multidrug efflux pump
VAYNFGRNDRFRLRRLFRRSLGIIAVTSVVSIGLGWVIAGPLAAIYVPVSTSIYSMSVMAFRIGLIGFLFIGFNIFTSAFFTALNNGKVAALLSLFRTLIFILVMLSLLPAIFGHNGVWVALPAAELLAIGMTVWFLAKRRRQYGYA